MGPIEYRVGAPITPAQFVQVLHDSTLAERRPVDSDECIAGMVEHGNLTITAWEGERLVGVARSVTDFHYCCYLSDLAVSQHLQHQGVGKELVRRTQAELGPRCKLILLAAPAAAEYYPKIGFVHHPGAWVLHEDASVDVPSA